MLELIVTAFLWTGTNVDHSATLNVSCDEVTLNFGGEPTARKKVISFWMTDLVWNNVWLYTVPMRVNSLGHVVLEPAGYWVEEIKDQKNMTIRVENRDYFFDLTGTREKIKCGVVAE